jgi:hypothetical protein
LQEVVLLFEHRVFALEHLEARDLAGRPVGGAFGVRPRSTPSRTSWRRFESMNG